MAGQACYFCGIARAMPGYPNSVCTSCDRLALTPMGERRWERSGHPGPFLIAGVTVFFRYPAFGGWTAMADPQGCASLEEFYESQGRGPRLRGAALHRRRERDPVVL